MGLQDLFSDFYTSLSFTELHAEAPPAEEEEKEEGGDDNKGDDTKKDDGSEKSDDTEEGGEQEGGDEEGGDAKEGGDEGGDDEEEEEEEEEPEDLKPKLEAECAKSVKCAPLKHHYEECAERVQQQTENPEHKGPKEDCVEEFFHLSHCASECAAPKLWRALK